MILVPEKKSFSEWNLDYTDLPSRQIKVKVGCLVSKVDVEIDF